MHMPPEVKWRNLQYIASNEHKKAPMVASFGFYCQQRLCQHNGIILTVIRYFVQPELYILLYQNHPSPSFLHVHYLRAHEREKV